MLRNKIINGQILAFFISLKCYLIFKTLNFEEILPAIFIDMSLCELLMFVITSLFFIASKRTVFCKKMILSSLFGAATYSLFMYLSFILANRTSEFFMMGFSIQTFLLCMAVYYIISDRLYKGWVYFINYSAYGLCVVMYLMANSGVSAFKIFMKYTDGVSCAILLTLNVCTINVTTNEIGILDYLKNTSVFTFIIYVIFFFGLGLKAHERIFDIYIDKIYMFGPYTLFSLILKAFYVSYVQKYGVVFACASIGFCPIYFKYLDYIFKDFDRLLLILAIFHMSLLVTIFFLKKDSFV